MYNQLVVVEFTDVIWLTNITIAITLDNMLKNTFFTSTKFTSITIVMWLADYS